MNVILSLTPVDSRVTDEQIAMLQKVSESMADSFNTECTKVQAEYPGLSTEGALDVVYLRTRSRWTKALEERLVQEHRDNKTVMISDWPNHSDKQYNPYTGQPLSSLSDIGTGGHW